MRFLFAFIIFILFTSFVFAESAYISEVYSKSVPHVDKKGNTLTKYKENKSFFPIAMWGVPTIDEAFGKSYDWSILKEGNFNTVWTWPTDYVSALEKGKEQDLQLVLTEPIPEDVLPLINNHPNLLANCWADEPLTIFNIDKMDEIYSNFTEYKNKAKKLAPNLKIFISDTPWIEPQVIDWWIKWNKSGAISCHDSYPIHHKNGEASRSLGTGQDMPTSVSLAVSSTEEKKPVWLIVGAFSQPNLFDATFPYRHPTPNQLRSCVYTAIENGATGIVYYIWDSFVSREYNCIGISKDPQIDMGNGDPKYTQAKPSDIINAKMCWDTATQVNKEVTELAPVILSPTDTKTKYTVKIEGKGVTEQPIHCMLKKDPKGGYVLFTTNIDASFLKAEYTFMKSISEATTLYENQKPLVVKNDTFSLSYEPFETHVIQIK